MKGGEEGNEGEMCVADGETSNGGQMQGILQTDEKLIKAVMAIAAGASNGESSKGQ